jgi:hypothetical protein
MPVTYRIVDIIVPNRASRKVKAVLLIEPADAGKLDGLSLEGRKPLKVLAFGLTTDRCAKTATVKTARKLTLEIEPWQDVLVRAVIKVQEPPKKIPAVAAFRISDTRSKAVVGGVTVVCSSPQYPDKLPSAPDPKNPCPLNFGGDLACVDPGADPRSGTGTPGVIETTKIRDLVVPIVNDGPKPITNATLHLEHTGGSNVQAISRVWHIGTVEPGGRFWATWEIDARSAVAGKYEASFVAQCDSYEPVRIRAGFEIRPRNW